jgi:hypothetical protein
MPHDVKRKSVASIGNGLHGPNLMPELDHLLNALFFVALLLYLITHFPLKRVLQGVIRSN